MTRRISRGLNCDRDSSACSEGNSGKWQAAGSLRRSDLLPDIPAIAEELPGLEMVGWSGLMAPTGTPAAIINATNRDIVQIPGSAEVKQKRSADGADGPQFTPE
jgi:tripartite-type tricarboxylate transporter receptor subunit TctC